MDWNTPHLGSWPAKLVLGISAKVRSKKAYTQQAIDKANAKEAERRRKRMHPNQAKRGSDDQGQVNELGEREYSVFDGDTLLVTNLGNDRIHRFSVAEDPGGGEWMEIRQGLDLEHWGAFQSSFQDVARQVMEVAAGKRGRAPRWWERAAEGSGDGHRHHPRPGG